MCYSAQASFAVGTALLPAGLYCARAAWRSNRAYLPLAAVPLVFSLQQFCEGLVWVGLGRDDAGLVRAASVVYLYFAMAFWPFWIPLSIFCAESRPGARRLLAALTVASLAWTWLYLPLPLDPDRWLKTEVMHHSVRYSFGGLPGYDLAPILVWRVGYLLLVAVPLVLGFYPGRWRPGNGAWSLLTGLVLGGTFALSYYLFWYAFTSVWCFVAALLSLCLCHLFSHLPEAGRERSGPGTGAAATPPLVERGLPDW